MAQIIVDPTKLKKPLGKDVKLYCGNIALDEYDYDFDCVILAPRKYNHIFEALRNIIKIIYPIGIELHFQSGEIKDTRVIVDQKIDVLRINIEIELESGSVITGILQPGWRNRGNGVGIVYKPNICICRSPATFKCSRCSKQWYCSKDCSKTDWSWHKYECEVHNSLQN